MTLLYLTSSLGMQLATLWSSSEVADLWSPKHLAGSMDSSCFFPISAASSAAPLPHNTHPLSTITSLWLFGMWRLIGCSECTRPFGGFSAEGAWLRQMATFYLSSYTQLQQVSGCGCLHTGKFVASSWQTQKRGFRWKLWIHH